MIKPAIIAAAEIVLHRKQDQDLDETLPIALQTSQMAVYPELVFQVSILRDKIDKLISSRVQLAPDICLDTMLNKFEPENCQITTFPIVGQRRFECAVSASLLAHCRVKSGPGWRNCSKPSAPSATKLTMPTREPVVRICARSKIATFRTLPTFTRYSGMITSSVTSL